MKYSDNYLRMMDISLNLARIGNWTADNYENKKKLIERFILQTDEYIHDLMQKNISQEAKPLMGRFIKDFKNLKQQAITSQNKDEWAERALTWANILQHRAKLA